MTEATQQYVLFVHTGENAAHIDQLDMDFGENVVEELREDNTNLTENAVNELQDTIARRGLPSLIIGCPYLTHSLLEELPILSTVPLQIIGLMEADRYMNESDGQTALVQSSNEAECFFNQCGMSS